MKYTLELKIYWKFKLKEKTESTFSEFHWVLFGFYVICFFFITYSKSRSSVDALIMQHCNEIENKLSSAWIYWTMFCGCYLVVAEWFTCNKGAKMVSSSWNGFPNPRPWSQCRVNVLFPKILRKQMRKMKKITDFNYQDTWQLWFYEVLLSFCGFVTERLRILFLLSTHLNVS